MCLPRDEREASSERRISADPRSSGKLLWCRGAKASRQPCSSPAACLGSGIPPPLLLRTLAGEVDDKAGLGERPKQPVRTCSSSFPLSLTQFSRTGIAHQRPYPCEGIELGRGMDSRRGSRACCCRSDLAFSLRNRSRRHAWRDRQESQSQSTCCYSEALST